MVNSECVHEQVDGCLCLAEVLFYAFLAHIYKLMKLLRSMRAAVARRDLQLIHASELHLAP